MTAHDRFRVALEGWTEQLVRPYVKRLENKGAGRSSKEFNDPVWSTIVLRPLEVAILDSPLLQRLRLIRQLGLVHLVYPAANHTRLEHSIGVVTQIDRLVESINEHFANRAAGRTAGDDPGRPIDDRLRNLLRLTALCHDVGHGAMSHVSQNALAHYPEVVEIRDEFSEMIEREDLPLPEIASFYIVGSAAFVNLLEVAMGAVEEHDLESPAQVIEQMQNLIIGKTVNDKIPLLHEFVSGPFDADKLDYMTRDALMSGVPVVTDTERLVQKIRAARVSPDKLPEKVAETVGKLDSHVMTGIDMSGARAIDELMFGRVLLHDKLYRHHKVRAAEAMVASIFDQIAPIAEKGPALLPLQLEDHQLLELKRSDVRALVGRDLKKGEDKAADVAERLTAMLRRRELFVRAFAFAPEMPDDPYHSEPDQMDGLEEVIGNNDDIEFRKDMVKRIAAELKAICTELAPELVKAYDGNFGPFLGFDPPVPPPDDTDEIHAYLISERSGNSEIVPARKGVAGAARWSQAYLLTRETGYVFATEELAPYAFLASEVVFRRDHGIRTSETMSGTYAKQDLAAIETLKRELDAKGFYKGLPSDLAPLPKQLSTAATDRRIRKVLENLRGYEGPRTSRSEKGLPLLCERRVFDWLKQFGTEFGDEPLRLLERLRLVGREQVVGALQEFLDEHSPQFEDTSVCPLGTAKDSSAITAYYAEDLKEVTVLPVLEALGREAPIVFIDDFVGSGQQAVSILEAWFGAEPTTELNEERGDPLSGDMQGALRNRPLGFVFASGRADGIKLLEDAFERLELKDAVAYLIDDPVAPRAFVGKKSEQRQKLEEYCQGVGLQLLDDGKERHNLEWREQRALGYGNEAFLVTFPYNTPTHTLTCLWKSGKVDGIDWTALLPRRTKL
jgi:HD superfamily phosphohydrolase